LRDEDLKRGTAMIIRHDTLGQKDLHGTSGKAPFFLLWRKSAICVCAALLLNGCSQSPVRQQTIVGSPAVRPESTKLDAVGITLSRFEPEYKIRKYTALQARGLYWDPSSANLGVNQKFWGGLMEASIRVMPPAAFFTVPVGLVFGGIKIDLPKPPPVNKDAGILLEAVRRLYGQQIALQSELQVLTQAVAAQTAIALSDTSSPRPGSLKGYKGLDTERADTVLEVSIIRFSHEGGLRGSPIALHVDARARLLSATNGKIHYSGEFRYRSPKLSLSEWTDNRTLKLQRTLSKATASLAREIVHEALLLEQNPETPLRLACLTADTDTPSGGTCGMGRSQHSLTVHLLYPRLPDKPQFGQSDPVVTSIRPTLRWEAIPYPERRGNAAQESSAKLPPVVYDLEIYARGTRETLVGVGDLAYSRYGLRQTDHDVEMPLEGCSTYFWSVRARYRVGSHFRATEWAGNYGERGPMGIRKKPYRYPAAFSLNPSMYYHRFITPCGRAKG
jgi:hypothetical protein